MPEPPARLWLNQARSDLKAAVRLLDVNDEETYCQAIAKFQQVVEKSVKALAAAIRDVGISPIHIGFTHEVEKIVSALYLLPREKGSKDIKARIKSLLHEGNRSGIKALCALAPKRPGPGESARRNTEYPFQKSVESWVAPHEKGVFISAEVERFRILASRIFEGTAGTLSAIERIDSPSTR